MEISHFVSKGGAPFSSAMLCYDITIFIPYFLQYSSLFLTSGPAVMGHKVEKELGHFATWKLRLVGEENPLLFSCLQSGFIGQVVSSFYDRPQSLAETPNSLV